MVGENLAAEEVPLSQSLRFGVDLQLAPLVARIIQLLDQNYRHRQKSCSPHPYICSCIHCTHMNSTNWHDGQIPETEIWVKVGGDKGADTVKVIFQLCNVISPNSVQNTCVFTVFEGRDTTTNLHVALDRYKAQFECLTAMEWRYKSYM